MSLQEHNLVEITVRKLRFVAFRLGKSLTPTRFSANYMKIAKRLTWVLVIAVSAVVLFSSLSAFYVLATGSTSLHVAITVKDLTTDSTIKSGHTILSGHKFAVTVTTNGIDCAGQYEVTALGSSGAPPEVLVQSSGVS